MSVPNRRERTQYWTRLSPEGLSLVRQLGLDSRKPLIRAASLARTIRAFGELGETAAIPALFYCLFDESSAVVDEASSTLERLFARVSPTLLPTLDEHIRADYFWQNPLGSDQHRDAVRELRVDFKSVVSLGLASSHGSGYIREQAVKRLDAEESSGREIPFLLLRLNDWVAPVRFAAEKAIGRRLHELSRPHYLDLLPLLVRLRGRQRSGESATFARIEELLCGDLLALVDGALGQDRRTRRYALTLAWDKSQTSGAQLRRQLIERILASADPAARQQAAIWLGEAGDPLNLAATYFPSLTSDASPILRHLALSWCAQADPQRFLPVVRRALLDPSAIIRATAQYYSQKIAPLDLREFYRSTIQAGDGKSPKASVSGLGETGRAGDVDLIHPLTGMRIEAGLRRAALGALGKLALHENLELFVHALQSEHPGISRQARLVLTPEITLVDAERLGTFCAKSPHPHVRRNALVLIRRLSKWRQLPLLVAARASRDAVIRAMAGNFLGSWLTNYNRTHSVQPGPADLVRLRDAVTRYGDSLGAELLREIQPLVGASS